MPLPTDTERVIGSTEKCFGHLVNSRPGLDVHRLLETFYADLPGDEVKISTVQTWQRGDHFPGGLHLLQLRCFMSLAGYGVQELARLDAATRQLGFAICFGVIDAFVAQEKLGYNTTRDTTRSLGAIWRLVVHGGKPVPSAKQKLTTLLTTSVKEEISNKQAYWRSTIKHQLGPLFIQPAAKPTPVVPPAVHPAIPVAFARMVAATTALGGPLLASNELRRAVLDATRAGQDLTELIGVLRQFIPDEG